MKRFSTRLALVFILLITLSVLLSGLIIVNVLERSHVEAAKDAMERQLRLLARELAWPEDPQSDEVLARFHIYAAATDELLDARITIVGDDGRVLADSRSDPASMDNHAEREEIRQAAEAGIGFSLRESDTLGYDLLYAAIPVASAEPGLSGGYLRIALGMDRLDATVGRLWSLLTAGLLAFVVLAGLIGTRIAKGLSRPLERIARVARQISRQQFDVRLDASGKDEFALLGRAINTMADSLQQQMEAARASGKRLSSVLDKMITGVMLVDTKGIIQLANRKVEDLLGFPVHDLEGRSFEGAHGNPDLARLVQRCLQQRVHLREELMLHYPAERIIEVNMVPIGDSEEADAGIVIVLHDITEIRRLERIRSQFAANVSHELRTPVAAIRGYAETLQAGALNDPEAAEAFLQIIVDESHRLGRLIEDILDLSKIESKQVSMQFVPVALAPFIEKTIGTLLPAARSNNIRLDWQVGEDLIIEADEDKLRQILLNLLSNAITYTMEGGSVLVRASLAPARGPGDTIEDERVRIEVRDTGIGIPRKDLPRIFERFYRVDKARSRGSGGTGLGLSIVKHLIDLHHGTIEVESVPGSGSAFTVELPIIQP